MNLSTANSGPSYSPFPLISKILHTFFFNLSKWDLYRTTPFWSPLMSLHYHALTFLKMQRRRQNKTLPTERICDLIRMTLGMHNFSFNNEHFLQIHGTAFYFLYTELGLLVIFYGITLSNHADNLVGATQVYLVYLKSRSTLNQPIRTRSRVMRATRETLFKASLTSFTIDTNEHDE